MAIRLSGLNSGLDTESIISELVKAKSTKKETLVKDQKKLSWKQDAWKSLNSKIYSFYSKALSNMRLQSDYSKKKTTSSSSAVSVITGADAPNSVQTMKIDKMAKAGYLTGAQLSKKSDTYNGSTKVTEALGIKAGSKFTVNVGGESTDITIDENTTIDNIVSNLRSAGVNANFDTNNQRFYISAKKTGADNDFTLTTTNLDGLEAMSKLGIASSMSDDVNTNALYTKYQDALVYLPDGTLDRDATAENLKPMIDEAVAKRIKEADYTTAREEAQTRIDQKSEELNIAKETFNNQFADSKYLMDPETGMPQMSSEKIQEAIDALVKPDESDTDAYEAYENQLAALNEQLSAAENIESIQGAIDADQSIVDWADKYYTPGADGEEGSATQALIDEITNSEIAKAENAKEVLSLYADNASLMNAIRVGGQDAKIYLNNAVYESSTNTFEINDLTITVNSMTNDEITLTTAEDTDGIYDMIKGFLKEYNELINEMDKLYNADSASEYSMLSDEEKESMSETEVKDWEDKIKGSLLRRDSTLGTVSQAMKTIMLSGIEMDNGKTMYLSDFGINTLGYFNSAENEKNAYHIDGDDDDSATSTNADKLKALIANDPETVSEFFSKLSRTLYSKLDSLMQSTDYSSAFTVYNDKLMKEEYENYKTKISDQEDKITSFEDAYYKKFTAMEVAMAKLQSQQSSLSSLFGS